MFRGIISLMLLANLTTGSALPVDSHVSVYDNSELLEVNQIPQKSYSDIEPVIDAKSALVMDLDTGIILYEKDARDRLPMASLTKIMTAVLILEHYSLYDVVTVEENYGNLSENEVGVRIWLRQYEKLTVGDLLTALLVRSAGDAALALAVHHSGSVEAFVEEMNEKAKVLNLGDTNFVNPIGLDADGHYSTSYDLAILTKYALRFPAFRYIVKQRSATIKSTDGRLSHSFETTNYLLGSYLNVLGVKTGTTDAAGASLINLANENGHEVISVLLNSPNRFQENKSLIDWTYRTYDW